MVNVPPGIQTIPSGVSAGSSTTSLGLAVGRPGIRTTARMRVVNTSGAAMRRSQRGIT
jgi:hypothetical protein